MHLPHQQIPKFTPIVIGCFLVVVLFLVGGISALSLTGRVLFVLFLPGFSILQVTASDEFDFLERLILSPIMGIAFTSLMALYLSLLNVLISEQTVIMSILLFSVPLLAYSWKRGGLRKTSFKSSTMSSTIFILILLMVISIVLISVPFPKNGILIPMGDDPATSTLAATMIVQQGKIPQSWAPYFPEQSSFTFPPGYPSVIAFLYLLDPLMSMPVLVSLFSVFFAIIHGEIFVLTRRVVHDHRVALCSAAFSALLSIGFYQMIIMGRFPGLVGLALTLNLLLFSYLYSITGKRKLLLLAGITLASLFITYSVSFITATLFVILFFSFRLIFSKHRKESLLGVATIIIIGIVLSSPWIFNIFNRLMVKVPTREYEALLAWFNMYSVQSEIGFTNLFMYYGYWLFLFGITGLLIISVRKRIGSFLLAWFLSIFLLMLNEIFKIQFPGWYYLQSGAFLNPTLSLPLSVLAGIGFVKAYDFLKKRFQNSSRKLMKTNLHCVLIAALLLSTFILGTTTIVVWKPEIKNDFMSNLQTNRISTADYNAMMWISKNTPKDAVIFNDHWIGTPSTWIPVISHRRIIMPLLSISEVGWSNIMFTRQDESIIVARNPNATEALSILKKYDVSYIYLSNHVSDQVEEWRNNYDAYLFLQSPHYKLAFNEDNAWVIRVIY
jgi:hypothetical protein